MTPLRLLLIAPGCDGHDVSEPWVGYQWASRLSRRHEVTLLTNFRKGHERPSVQIQAARVVEWSDLPLTGRFERFNALVQPGYARFYLQCRRWIARALRRGEHFDLAHQVLPVAMRYPCPVAGLPIPYVLGPIGGGLHDPPGFRREPTTDPWYVRLRSLDRLRLEFDPMLRRTYHDAACVIGIAPYVAEQFSSVNIARFQIIGETAVTVVADPVDRRSRSGPVRLLYVGRIVRSKGVREAIQAVAILARSPRQLSFDIVGDGVDRSPCEHLVDELNIRRLVTFHGSVPKDHVDEFYRSADVFVFPSYREPGSNVVLEAMSFGLPVIAAARGGPGEALDDRSGYRIPTVTREQFVREIAEALGSLIDDPRLRQRMGSAARTRVATIARWEHRLEQIEAVYGTVLQRNPGG